jgi:outer membrane protein, multidrug efflux system
MTNKIFSYGSIFFASLTLLHSCKIPQVTVRSENNTLPAVYAGRADTVNAAAMNWKNYFSDTNLITLIDTALRNNQELNITLQEINMLKNEIQIRKGEYLPFVNFKAGAGMEKEGEYTRNGAIDEQLEIKDGKHFPKPFPDVMLGAYATWEADIWKKLHRAKDAAALRYLAGAEGRNFMVTNLIAEIADTYYELVALDNLLDIVEKNIEIQSSALRVVRQQKDAAKVTQLAVNRFEAQLLNTQNLQYAIKQNITEKENRIRFLTAGFQTQIPRTSGALNISSPNELSAGIPAQLLANRPDIRQAELELAAAKLDVKIARANFYPSLAITAGVGFRAFNPIYIFNPESILYNLAGDVMAPLINRNAIKATYNNAGAKQLQAVYNYERTILNAYLDVQNQLAKMDNYAKSYNTKKQEVDILASSVNIAGNLFNSARADYAEVLLTQREALEARMDLIEIQLKQRNARVNIYRALGGGWK